MYRINLIRNLECRVAYERATAVDVVFSTIRIIFVFLLVFLSKSLWADNTDFVSLPTGEVIQGDYRIAAENIELLGTIDGDAYVAGMQVFIDGEIKGDLLLAAGSATIGGKIHGNIRFVGGQATLSGEVLKSVSVLGGSLQLLPSVNIHGNLVAIAGTVDFSGVVSGTGSIVASSVRVAGAVDKTLDVSAGRLRVTNKALIGGDLNYHGNEDAAIDSRAIIKGTFTQHPTLLKKFFDNRFFQGFLVGTKFLALVMNFLFTFVVGIFVIRMFPNSLKAAHHALREHPIKALGLGVVLLIALPLASLVLLMTVLGAPFAVALLAINILSFYTAKIFSITWVSNFLAKKIHMKASPIMLFLLGLVVYFALTTIPMAGYFIALAALLFGLGAAMLARTGKHLFDKA